MVPLSDTLCRQCPWLPAQAPGCGAPNTPNSHSCRAAGCRFRLLTPLLRPHSRSIWWKPPPWTHPPGPPDSPAPEQTLSDRQAPVPCGIAGRTNPATAAASAASRLGIASGAGPGSGANAGPLPPPGPCSTPRFRPSGFCLSAWLRPAQRFRRQRNRRCRDFPYGAAQWR